MKMHGKVKSLPDLIHALIGAEDAVKGAPCCSTKRTFIIDPRGPRYEIWEAVTAIALLVVAIMVPLQVGFFAIEGEMGCSIDAFTVFNRIMDFIFLVDLILQFFTMCTCAHQQANHLPLP